MRTFVFGALVGAVSFTVCRWFQSKSDSGNAIDFERLIADIDEAIAVEGEDGTVLFANDSFVELVGADPTGENIEAVLSSAPALQQRVADGTEGIESVERETGTEYFEVVLFSINEQSTGQLVLFHDVTDLEERRQQLEEQNEQLERFATVVSHDLRNPLDVALGRTNALAESTDDPDLTIHAESTQRALERMETIITDVLTVTHTCQEIGEKTTVPLEKISERAWKTVETENAKLRVQTDAVVTANPNGLTHILENLFRNTVEHAGADATVTIGSLPERSGFYVEDNGPGIAADRREEIREPGKSGDSYGTGLGLAIVENVTAAHDWELSLTDGDNGGARFEFTGVELSTSDIVAQQS